MPAAKPLQDVGYTGAAVDEVTAAAVVNGATVALVAAVEAALAVVTTER